MGDEEKKETASSEALLFDALGELQSMSLKVMLFPYDHPLVTESVEKAFACLSRLLKDRETVPLEFRTGRIFFEGRDLEAGGSIRDLAGDLCSRGLASVSFRAGVTKKDIVSFHKAITRGVTPREIEKAIADEGVTNILVKTLHSPEPAVQETAQDVKGQEAERWQACMSRLIDGVPSGDDRDVIAAIPPDFTADLLNAMGFEYADDGAYDRLFSVYLEPRGILQSPEIEGEGRIFFDRLKPAIQRRLGSRLDPLARPPAEDRTEFSGTREIVIPSDEEEAEPEQDEEISPGTEERQQQEFYFDCIGPGKAGFHDIEIGEKTFRLFDQASIRRFMSRNYQQELGGMMEPARDAAPFVEECREDVVQEEAVDVLLEIIDSESLGGEFVLSVLTRLTQAVDDLIDAGRLGKTLEVYNALSSHTLQGKHSHHVSSMITYFFHSDRFISRLVQAFRLWGRKDRENARRLTRALRTSLVDPLLNALVDEPRIGMRRFLISLLVAVRGDALPLVAERLRDGRWYVIRNMIYIIRECGGRQYVSQVRDFTKHGMPLVCLEALRTLLSFQSPEAVPTTVRYLESDSRQLQRGAVRLAGAYRVKESVPHLLRILEEKDLLGTKLKYKKEVLRALGRIGDPGVIPRLIQICSSSALVYRESYEDLKLEIFKTLYKYPLPELKPLLEIGLKSGNPDIYAISERLMGRYHKSIAKKWIEDAG